MLAALVKESGPPSILVVEEIPDPTPAPGEVVIEVAAFSINFPDIMVVEGTYQNLPPRPFCPGKEAAGRVIAVGDGVDHVTVGQRVLTLVEYGGYAEKLVVSEDLVMALPDGISYEEAAACGLVYSTAHFGAVAPCATQARRNAVGHRRRRRSRLGRCATGQSLGRTGHRAGPGRRQGRPCTAIGRRRRSYVLLGNPARRPAGDALQYVKDGKVKGKVVLTTGLG
jgi:hypothetical protein